MNAAQDRRRDTEVDVLLAEFGEWLDTERGLARESVRCYRNQARTFLAYLPEPLERALAELDPASVTRFVLEYSAASNSVWPAKAQLTALRSLLRFLHVSPGGAAAPNIQAVGAAFRPRPEPLCRTPRTANEPEPARVRDAFVGEV